MTRKSDVEKVEKKASSYTKKQPELQKVQQRPRPKSGQLVKLNLTTNLQKRLDSSSFCEYSLASSSNLSGSEKKQRTSRTASSKRRSSAKAIKKHIPDAKKKLYYFDGVNGDELINQSLESIGWERTDDKTCAELEWRNEKDPLDSALPRDNDKLLHQLPKSKLLTSKSGLLTCLREYDRIMSREREYSLKKTTFLAYTDFFPESYRLDHKPEREAFCAAYRIGDLWVSSPIKLLNAKEAYFIRDQDEVNSIARMEDTQDELIKKWPSGVVLPRVNHRYTCLTLSRLVQRYATNPLLLNGKRFVLRAFMMITCSQPLVVFYHPGYCMLYHKVAIDKLASPDLTLQNYVVWSMQKLNNFVNQHYAETEGLCRDWVASVLSKRCQRIMLHCLNAARNRLNLKRGYFDLIGCDFLIKDDFSVTLLEMKSNPALFTGCRALKELMPVLVRKLLAISIECFEKAMRNERVMPLDAEQESCVLLYNDDFHEKIARKEELERKAKEEQDLADRRFREEEQAARLSKVAMRPLDLTHSSTVSGCEDESKITFHPYLRRVHRRSGSGAPEYYTDVMCEHIDAYLTSLGWRRTYDNNNVDYKLKWCANRTPLNYALFREREQLLFQFPNARLLTTKTGLLKTLQIYDRVMSRVQRFSLEVVLDYRTFFPESYDMEDERDCAAFFAAYRPGDLWISKPSNSSQGRGIHLVRDAAEFELVRRQASESLKERCYQMHQLSRVPFQRILQRYITNPLLAEGRKFDLRNYMLITCACPQVVFYHDGYCRLSCNKYDVRSRDLTVHLTNQSVQRKSPCYAADDTVWSMAQLNDYVNDNYGGATVERDWVRDALPKRCQEIMLHCFNAVRGQLECKLGYFDLIGCDFLIHDDFSVSLIEMTSSPAMGTYNSVLASVIPDLLTQFLAITIESFEKVSKGRPIFPLAAQHDCTLLFRDNERSAQYMLSSPDDRKSFYHRTASTAWR